MQSRRRRSATVRCAIAARSAARSRTAIRQPTIRRRSSDSARRCIRTSARLPAADYFRDLFETALEPGEIITSIEFPVPRRAAYCKFPNPASRYAVAGVLVADFGGQDPRRRHRRRSVCVSRDESRTGAECEARAASGRRGRNRLRTVQQRPARHRGIPRESRARDGAPRGCRADRLTAALSGAIRSVRCHAIAEDIGSVVLEADRSAARRRRGEIQVRLKACAVNFPDILMIQGKYQFKPPLPFAPGGEAAGDVVAVGAGVTRARRRRSRRARIALRRLLRSGQRTRAPRRDRFPAR